MQWFHIVWIEEAKILQHNFAKVWFHSEAIQWRTITTRLSSCYNLIIHLVLSVQSLITAAIAESEETKLQLLNLQTKVKISLNITIAWCKILRKMIEKKIVLVMIDALIKDLMLFHKVESTRSKILI